MTKFKAIDAERLLNDPILKEALSAIRAEIIEQWTATPARDTEGREWIWRHMKVAEKFEAILRSYVENGKIEAFNEKQGVIDRMLKAVK